jgi:hypothetical protein
MTFYHRPGWTQPNGHLVRSQMEASLCDYLTGAKEAHVHGAQAGLSFEVTIAPRRHALFTPTILLTDTRKDGQTIVLEPVDSIRPGGGVRRLRGFRQAHRADYFVILIARRTLHAHLPDDVYDLLVPLDDYRPLDEFLVAL